MRYHYEPESRLLSVFGETYVCDHPVYSSCTLFKIGNRGLAIIQQRFSESDKTSWWGPIDEGLSDALYLHPEFQVYFNKRAKPEKEGLYPTVTVRQIMWALRMKPLKKERWETVFDRKEI